MAEPEEITPNNTIPALPPLPGIAPLVHAPLADDGQIWPLGSTGTAVQQAMTPQHSQRIIMPAGSAISSLTNPTVMTTSSPGAPDEVDDTPKKGNVLKRKFCDFSCAFSQDNSLLSGDESDRWDKGTIFNNKLLQQTIESVMTHLIWRIMLIKCKSLNIFLRRRGTLMKTGGEGGDSFFDTTTNL